MCPNMCFGMVICIDKEFDEGRIADTVNALAKSHPFIKALISHDDIDNRYYYDVTDFSQTEIAIYSENISGIDAPDVMEEFDRITARDFDLFKEGMLKLSAWPSDSNTIALLVFHHLLADGRGALEFAKEFAAYYVTGKEPSFATERLISSTSDLPAGSDLPFISKMLVNRANRQWRKEKIRLSYEEYHRFADDFIKRDTVIHELSALSKEKMTEIAAKCKDNGVTVNDYLLADFFFKENTNRIVIAADIRDALKCYNQGALGNYSTAFSVELKKRSDDLFAVAKQVHAAVRKISGNPSALYLVLQCYAALEPGLLDAAMIASRSEFKSKAAKYIGKLFFHLDKAEGYSITNLGKTESSVISDACFIPPASPAMKKTMGVLTLNGKMRICVSRR